MLSEAHPCGVTLGAAHQRVAIGKSGGVHAAAASAVCAVGRSRAGCGGQPRGVARGRAPAERHSRGFRRKGSEMPQKGVRTGWESASAKRTRWSPWCAELSKGSWARVQRHRRATRRKPRRSHSGCSGGGGGGKVALRALTSCHRSTSSSPAISEATA
eukprot:5622557-Pleurochrysis_carterae.AAC.2